ncbi:MAG TPA: hypothetical protein VLZ03_02610 [Thermodesulfobacteriota bacterium]|nr:hypothetical protein [Thermodesulfobacteriota bacterium]
MVSGQQELGMVIKQTPEKGLTRWHRGEGTVIPMFRDPVILDIQEPTRLNAPVAERKSLSLFPHPMTKNCCAWSASTIRRVGLGGTQTIRKENKMKKKVKAEWHPKDNKHIRTDDDWKRIMAEPYVLETEKEEKKEKKKG